MTRESCSRRRFLLSCGSALAAASVHSREDLAKSGGAQSVVLVWPDGSAVSPNALQIDEEYLFFYPYHSTPCFLLRLGRPTSRDLSLMPGSSAAYRWPGGVGPEGDVVAFSAICSHKLSHPSASVSFIGYRGKSVGFLNSDNRVVRRGGVIQCCSEQSIYDPAAGARVLSGPAPAPLAAVDLLCPGDSLYADGVYGADVIERFLERFAFRLGLEFGEQRYRELVAEKATVFRASEYTRQRVACS